jgi:hypothetical protein
MIREPTVGMRVEVTGKSSKQYGNIGTIKRLDDDYVPILVGFLSGDIHWYANVSLTEIEESDMKKGDLVTITDDNSSVYMSERFDSAEIDTSAEFEVIGLPYGIYGSEGRKWHDIVLKNNITGNIWLHSKQYCIEVVSVKEVTAEQMMRDMKEKYGCTVKITE